MMFLFKGSLLLSLLGFIQKVSLVIISKSYFFFALKSGRKLFLNTSIYLIHFKKDRYYQQLGKVGSVYLRTPSPVLHEDMEREILRFVQFCFALQINCLNHREKSETILFCSLPTTSKIQVVFLGNFQSLCTQILPLYFEADQQ